MCINSETRENYGIIRARTHNKNHIVGTIYKLQMNTYTISISKGVVYVLYSINICENKSILYRLRYIY